MMCDLVLLFDVDVNLQNQILDDCRVSLINC
jgi:hypothetical protein